MDLLEYAAEDAVLLFAGRVVETFHHSSDRSFRTPAAWIGVRVQPSRHDRVHFSCPGPTSNFKDCRARAVPSPRSQYEGGRL
jgi:hypothetical protein